MNETVAAKIDIDSFQFGYHKLYFIERDDPTYITINYILKCQNCKSYATASIKLRDVVVDFKWKIASKLFNEFRQNIPESCLEAKQLGIINSIHNL